MKTEITTITPQHAELLLARNTSNRKVSPVTVAAYKRDMIAGHWQLNGEAIVVSATGQLLNGQHRLYACIEAGTPFQTVLVSGAPDEVVTTIDAGRPRTISDRMTMLGYPYATRVQGCVSTLRIIAEGQSNAKNTPTEALEFLARNPGLLDSVKAAEGSQKIAVFISALHYIGVCLDRRADADDFVATFKTGVGLGKDDPAFVLREKVMRDAISQSKTPRHVMLKLSCQAFERYLRGERCQVLRAPRDISLKGWTMDAFNLDRSEQEIAAE